MTERGDSALRKHKWSSPPDASPSKFLRSNESRLPRSVSYNREPESPCSSPSQERRVTIYPCERTPEPSPERRVTAGTMGRGTQRGHLQVHSLILPSSAPEDETPRRSVSMGQDDYQLEINESAKTAGLQNLRKSRTPNLSSSMLFKRAFSDILPKGFASIGRRSLDSQVTRLQKAKHGDVDSQEDKRVSRRSLGEVTHGDMNSQEDKRVSRRSLGEVTHGDMNSQEVKHVSRRSLGEVTHEDMNSQEDKRVSRRSLGEVTHGDVRRPQEDKRVSRRSLGEVTHGDMNSQEDKRVSRRSLGEVTHEDMNSQEDKRVSRRSLGEVTHGDMRRPQEDKHGDMRPQEDKHVSTRNLVVAKHGDVRRPQEDQHGNVRSLVVAKHGDMNSQEDKHVSVRSLVVAKHGEMRRPQVDKHGDVNSQQGKHVSMRSLVVAKHGDVRSLVEAKHGDVRSLVEAKHGNVRSLVEAKHGDMRSLVEAKSGDIRRHKRSLQEAKHSDLGSSDETKHGDKRSQQEVEHADVRSPQEAKRCNLRRPQEAKCGEMKSLQEAKCGSMRSPQEAEGVDMRTPQEAKGVDMRCSEVAKHGDMRRPQEDRHVRIRRHKRSLQEDKDSDPMSSHKPEHSDKMSPPEVEHVEIRSPQEAKRWNLRSPQEAKCVDTRSPQEAKHGNLRSPQTAEGVDLRSPQKAKCVDMRSPQEAKRRIMRSPQEAEAVDMRSPSEARYRENKNLIHLQKSKDLKPQSGIPKKDTVQETPPQWTEINDHDRNPPQSRPFVTQTLPEANPEAPEKTGHRYVFVDESDKESDTGDGPNKDSPMGSDFSDGEDVATLARFSQEDLPSPIIAQDHHTKTPSSSGFVMYPRPLYASPWNVWPASPVFQPSPGHSAWRQDTMNSSCTSDMSVNLECCQEASSDSDDATDRSPYISRREHRRTLDIPWNSIRTSTAKNVRRTLAIEPEADYNTQKSLEDGFIDTHCHLDFLFARLQHKRSFAHLREQYASTFPPQFQGCITDYCDPRTLQRLPWQQVLGEDQVWGAFGCHPHFAQYYNDTLEEEMLQALKHPKAIAFGEMGLDYSHKCSTTIPDQHAVFERQLKLAIPMGKPLVIHCRDAIEDLFNIMKKWVPRDYKIHQHCFTGSYEDIAPHLSEFPNMAVGFTAVLTYPSAEKVRQAVTRIPLDRIIVETDAPFFVPRQVPKSVCKFAHPGLALHTIQEIARLKDLPVKSVMAKLRENTRRLYSI